MVLDENLNSKSVILLIEKIKIHSECRLALINLNHTLKFIKNYFQ